MVDATYVSGTAVAVAGSAIRFVHVISRDGAALNLTGKTVEATIRAVQRGGSFIIDDALEDLSVTLGAAPANGEVDWTLAPADSALLAPLCPPDHVNVAWFDLQYWVREDDYAPQVFRFPVRSAAD